MGFHPDRMETAHVRLSLAAVEERLPSDFPPILWERISNGMLSQADVFQNEILGAGLI